MSSAATSTKRPLVLHMDINKTIIMCDPVKGVGCNAMINALLSEACWGTWDEKPLPSDAESKRMASSKWKFQIGPDPQAQPGLVTYSELLEDILKMEKKELQQLKNNFTDPGHPGEAVRETYLELQSALKLPGGVVLPEAPAAVGEGCYFLLPSFLKLILHLEEQERDFRIVFRTFGIDIADVISEFNLFCKGAHPCFPSVPSGLKRRAVTLPADSGEFYRDDAGLHLAMCAKVKGDVELVQMFHGHAGCAAAMHEKLFGESPSFSMAVRDYFPFWRASKESDDSGKPLLVESVSENSVHHIFFDDNIERDRAHIVDARNGVSGDPMPFSETQGVYLVKAEPLFAIKDPNYFIGALALAEERLSC